MLLCGVNDVSSSHTVNTIRLTRPRSAPPALPFTHMLVRLCCASVTTSGGTSEGQPNFTPHRILNFHLRIWRIGAGTLHSKGSVNRASYCSLRSFTSLCCGISPKILFSIYMLSFAKATQNHNVPSGLTVKTHRSCSGPSAMLVRILPGFQISQAIISSC